MITCPVCLSDDIRKSEVINMAQTSYDIYKDIVIYKCDNCSHEFNVNNVSANEFDRYYNGNYLKYVYTPSTEYEIFDEDEKTLIICQSDIECYISYLVSLNNESNIHSIHSDGYKKIILEQFLEHCWNLENVMSNIKNIIHKDAEIMISVPSANEYERLIKEHVQHFNEKSLLHLLRKYNFDDIKIYEGLLPILNGKIKLQTIESTACNKKQPNTYCYGASRELLFLLENHPSLRNTPITAILDDSNKQGQYISSIPIVSSDTISSLGRNDTIYITAIFHKETIRDKILSFGFSGKIIDTLTL